MQLDLVTKVKTQLPLNERGKLPSFASVYLQFPLNFLNEIILQ
jgi:hypothetical protein